MPKIKTKKSIAKRFIITKNKKVMKYSPKTVKEICDRIEQGDSQKDAAILSGIEETGTRSICLSSFWTHFCIRKRIA